MTTAHTLNRKMPKGISGKEAIKENWKKNQQDHIFN